MPQILSSKPISAPAPKSAADYQAEAMAEFAKGDQTQTTPPPAEAGDHESSGMGTGGKTEGDPKDAPSAEKEKPKEPEKKKEDVNIPPNIKAAFEKLTADKAAFRQEKEGLIQQVKEANERAAKAEAFVNAKTPMELLRAAGFTWKDAVEEITGVKAGGEETPKPGKKEEPKKPTLEDLDPEVAAELKAWRAERAAKKQAEGRAAIRKSMEDVAKKAGDKYGYTMKLGKVDDALDFIEAHFAKYRELPGSTPQESMEIALAHVEENLRGQAEKWKAVLTPASESASVPDAAEESSESAAPESATSETASKTLTHSQAGALRTGPSKEPQTAEEFRAAALREMLKAERAGR